MSEKNWRTDFEIVWHGKAPPKWVEGVVRTDMLDELRDLSRPSQLIIHTVLLGESYDGPSVAVWGKIRDRRFHAEYEPETKWETLSGKPFDAALSTTHNPEEK